jgi:hypothetical protein
MKRLVGVRRVYLELHSIASGCIKLFRAEPNLDTIRSNMALILERSAVLRCLKVMV